ncbi:MAG: hypothetical protein KR126chlam6_00962 [Candidatus Anoxychlamydiales bacterium]|nr:hypothetical protein [Candidatus Anoxychlamydiales bacterium]
MTGIPLSEARSQLPDIVNKVAYGNKHIILTRRGKKVAAIVSIEELELIEAIEDRIDLEDARKAIKDIQKQGSISWKKVKAELGL